MAGCIDPNGFIIFPDPEVTPDKLYYVSSAAGIRNGVVVPSSGNNGHLEPSVSGQPSQDAEEFEMMISQAGSIDSARWIWKYPTETDANWRGVDDDRRIWGYEMPWGNAGLNTNVAAVYSHKYNRLLVFQDVNIKYRDADTFFNDWSATTWSPELEGQDAIAGFGFAIDVTELPDGTLILAVLIGNFEPQTPTNRRYDFDLYKSTDGGLTWTRTLCDLLLTYADKTSGNLYNEPDPSSKFRIRASGGWIRLSYISTQGTTVNQDLHTVVSGDGGASWREIAPIVDTPQTNDASFDTYPHDVVGLGFGSFYLEILSSTAGITAYTATADGDWIVHASGTKGLSGTVMALGLVAHQGWIYSWIWGEDETGIISNSGWSITRSRPEDLTDLNPWTSAHQQTHVVKYRQQGVTLVSTGTEIIGVAPTKRAVGVGSNLGPVTQRQGGWTQASLGIYGGNRGAFNDAVVSERCIANFSLYATSPADPKSSIGSEINRYGRMKLRLSYSSVKRPHRVDADKRRVIK